MVKMLLSLLGLFIFSSSSYAISPLPADQAFVFAAQINDKNQLVLEWSMPPGYYLYRDKLFVNSPSSSRVHIGRVNLPKGKKKKDNILGSYQIYTDHLIIPINLLPPIEGRLNLTVRYQGCSKEGFCYPPFKKDLTALLSSENGLKNVVITSVMRTKPNDKPIEHLLKDKGLIIIFFSFLTMGLLLAFTPCVLPMVPILSGIILGHKHMSTAKGFFLSLSYVLGMAITYAIAGIVIALIGSRLQAVFQAPWIIVLSSGLFVLLALSLFGFYNITLPARWRQKLTELSNKQKGGSYCGVFFMGVLSSLIISPCVSPPLVGVLAYIAQTGNVALGGASLFALGLGMGIPLLILGLSAGRLLPKAGEWMVIVERLFGIVLLALAIWMLSRVIPGSIALLLWSILCICSAVYMGAFTNTENHWKKLFRGLGLVVLIYGILLMIGAVMRNSDPLRPLEGTRFTAKKNKLLFVAPKSMKEFNTALMKAKAAHQPVMLDFYADWCVECIKMDRDIFTQPSVSKLLSGFLLLRADVTKNTEFDQELLKRFNVVAPPTIVFFKMDGQELADARIIGGVSETELLNYLRQF